MPDRKATRAVMRWTMAIFFAVAGIFHIGAPESFLPIMPLWVPLPYVVVVATGVLELAASAALLTRRLRSIAGVTLALYALAVWPANFKHAFEHVPLSSLPDSWWYHGPRLAAQPLIMWWALFCAEVIDWPFSQRRN